MDAEEYTCSYAQRQLAACSLGQKESMFMLLILVLARLSLQFGDVWSLLHKSRYPWMAQAAWNRSAATYSIDPSVGGRCSVVNEHLNMLVPEERLNLQFGSRHWKENKTGLPA